MTNSSAVKVTAKSLEQAIAKASYKLGVPHDKVAYEVVKETTRNGLFSFFKTPSIEISAWDKATRAQNKGAKDNAKKTSSSSRNKTNNKTYNKSANSDRSERVKREPVVLSPEKQQALIEELRVFCLDICKQVADTEDVSVEAELKGERLVLNIQNEYISGQVMRNTKLAEALEHILRKKPRHLKQELPFRIFIDVGEIRQNRENDLIKMAAEFSNKVSDSRRPLVLNYKSSYDRKIIHMALDKDEKVFTKSIGSGASRKLMIIPTGEVDKSLEPDKIKSIGARSMILSNARRYPA